MAHEDIEFNAFKYLKDRDQRNCDVPREPFKFVDGTNRIRIMTCPVAHRLTATDQETKKDREYDVYEAVVFNYATMMCQVARFSIYFFKKLAALPGNISTFPMEKKLRVSVENAGKKNVEYTNVSLVDGPITAEERADQALFIEKLAKEEAAHLIKNSSPIVIEELKESVPVPPRSQFKNPLLKAAPAAIPSPAAEVGAKRKMIDEDLILTSTSSSKSNGATLVDDVNPDLTA